MYKVMLVDDEPNVRQGIRMMIPWDELDCTIIAEAEDGDDGLSKIMSLNPDIVIADIKMPGKTGIEMTEAAKALGFKGKVLILSGYSDFTYAKEAIALGVENFILKPVDEDELIEAIKSIGEKISKEKENTYQQKVGSDYLNEQIVRGLFAGQHEFVESARRQFMFSSYYTCIICCDLEAGERETAYEFAKSFFDTVSNVNILPIDISGVLGVLFKGWKGADVCDLLKRLYKSMEDKVFIALGTQADSPEMIHDSFAAAEDIYRNRFIYKHCGVVTPDAVIQDKKSSEAVEETDYSARCYAFMEINDTAKLEKTLDSFMESMQGGYTPEMVKVNCITFMMNIRSRLGKGVSDKKPENLITDEFISSIGKKQSLFEIVNDMKKCLSSVSDSCFGRTTKSTMERVVQYIKSNYTSELRLEMLAGIFGYNSAYLGKVFHQYTGENFNNYLDEIRITEAKRLLMSEEYKVYEVAEMVGYTNINYFHNKFKKYVGVSPLSFKKNKGVISTETDDTDESEE
ncbi:MAG: response regulator [Huintestinicola sp.]